MRVVVFAIIIGIAGFGYYWAHPHELFCCQDPFPLLHEHPPHDSLGMAQQEGRGSYGAPDDFAAECIERGSVAEWLYYDNGRVELTCSPHNVAGEN